LVLGNKKGGPIIIKERDPARLALWGRTDPKKKGKGDRWQSRPPPDSQRSEELERNPHGRWFRRYQGTPAPRYPWSKGKSEKKEEFGIRQTSAKRRSADHCYPRREEAVQPLPGRKGVLEMSAFLVRGGVNRGNMEMNAKNKRKGRKEG